MRHGNGPSHDSLACMCIMISEIDGLLPFNNGGGIKVVVQQVKVAGVALPHACGGQLRCLGGEDLNLHARIRFVGSRGGKARGG
jgi:hypothetical protein